MNIVVGLAKGFTGIIGAGATNLTGLITGMIPNLLILLTLVNAIIALIGEEKVNAFAKKMTKFRITRYTILPFLALFFFTNPMCYTMGRFVEEDQKPGFIDATFRLAHPITGIFAHANAGEIFIWSGISSGIVKLGLDATPLAVRYLIVGLIVTFISGNVTEFVTKRILATNK